MGSWRTRGPDLQRSDPYNLARFVEAQDRDRTYERVLGELGRGQKQSHWMWFVFPQIRGLGQSSMSRKYAISSLDEAKVYLLHPVLGPRLIECSSLCATAAAKSAVEIFGEVDAQKLRSSMTLFSRADSDEFTFQLVLDLFFDGSADPATDALI